MRILGFQIRARAVGALPVVGWLPMGYAKPQVDDTEYISPGTRQDGSKSRDPVGGGSNGGDAAGGTAAPGASQGSATEEQVRASRP